MSAPKTGVRSPTPAAASFDASRASSNSVTFTLRATGGVFPVVIPSQGPQPVYTLVFPANSVCDPKLSSAAECVPAVRTIQVTATYYNLGGRSGVDFSPELRFVDSKTVTLSTMRLRKDVLAMAALPPGRQFWGTFAILYTPNAFQSIIDDAAYDKDVVTHIDVFTGQVWRRIKHFSGYVAGTGLNCDPSLGPVDPTCNSGSTLTTTP